MEHNKQEFVRQFAELLQMTSTYSDLYRLDYVQCGAVEWLYITFSNLTQKRINISGENCVGIIKEFLHSADRGEYLSSGSQCRKDEFLPDWK